MGEQASFEKETEGQSNLGATFK
jgi:hypothetical protein